MIRDEKKFREAAAAGFDGIFDWDFLRAAWPSSKMAPMDIDAVVERWGHFLVFETKSSGVSIPRGQVITLEALVANGSFTVMVLWGKTVEEIKHFDVWSLVDGEVTKTPIDGDANDVLQFAAEWFRRADNEGYTTQH
tara:strand:- start:1860 stop:2270 length:411 start_codon:yes stop_codon:yes gene_type:complete